jgi:hypothetical protein
MLTRIDDAQIDWIFQPIANKVQRSLGVDCISLAKALAVLAGMAVIGLFFLTKSWKDLHITLMSVIMLLSLHGIVFKTPPRITHGFLNEERFSSAFRFGRIVFTGQFVIISPAVFILEKARLDKGDLLFVGLLALIWVVFYFRACTPLPPQKSWARKAVEKAKMVLNGVTEPIPVPVET